MPFRPMPPFTEPAMFNFFRSLFFRKAAPPPPADSFQRLNEVAPLRSYQQVSTGESSFVCREPILNRHEKVAGYEFLLNQRLHKRFSGKSPALRRAYDDVLIINLAALGTGSLLGHLLSFVDLSPLSFDNPQLASLEQANTVLMVDPLDANGELSAGLAARLAEIKARGFKVGCYLSSERALEEIVALCDFIQISTPAYDGLQIADWVRRLRKRDGHGRLALVAADIESSDDFQVCFRAGFDYFHGPFVNRREGWHPPRANVDRSRIMQVLGQLRSGVEGSELARSIRQDPVVTYKLLRYINSSANGLEHEITSIEQSLLLLGRERFYRWLSLLLFDVQKSGYIERVLTEQALARASLMERLGRRARQAGVNPDQLFLAGLFSQLEKLLDRPLAEILDSVAMPPAVNEALLTGSGPLAPFLNLAVACENGDQKATAIWATACQLDALSVNQELLAALVWANEVLEMDD